MSGGITRTKQPLAHGASGENYSEKSSNFLKEEITPSMNNTWANGLWPLCPQYRHCLWCHLLRAAVI